MLPRKKIDSEISAVLLAVQAGLAYIAFINQKNGMDEKTNGVSLGMFTAIFSATNTWLSVKSFIKNKTFSTSLKIVPYLVTAAAYILFSYKCINSRVIQNEEILYRDDLQTLGILVVGYLVSIAFMKYKGTLAEAFENPITLGYFSGFTVGVAHIMFSCHMLLADSHAGVTIQFILFTLFASSIRFVQNLADIGLAGLDSQKRALLISESWNVATWIIVGLTFFYLK